MASNGFLMITKSHGYTLYSAFYWNAICYNLPLCLVINLLASHHTPDFKISGELPRDNSPPDNCPHRTTAPPTIALIKKKLKENTTLGCGY